MSGAELVDVVLAVVLGAQIAEVCGCAWVVVWVLADGRKRKGAAR